MVRRLIKLTQRTFWNSVLLLIMNIRYLNIKNIKMHISLQVIRFKVFQKEIVGEHVNTL